jgi:serine/threonine protein kinase
MNKLREKGSNVTSFSSRKSHALLSSSSLNEAYLLRSVLYNADTQTVHPHIVTLLSIKHLSSFSINSSIYFIFDYAHNRDLATHGLLYGGTERQLSNEQIQMYLYQLISAVIYCHDRLVYHCAIELKHLLITRTGQLKLSNFEYAKHATWPTMRIDTTEVSVKERETLVDQESERNVCT